MALICTEGLQVINKDAVRQRFSKAIEYSKYEYEEFFLAQFFDLNFSYEDESCTVVFPVEDFMLNVRGKLHGGVIAFVTDVSMGHLCNKIIGPCVTVEVKIQYLSAISSGKISCKASFLKKGKSIAYLESKMTNEDGDLLAVATATFKKVRHKGE